MAGCRLRTHRLVLAGLVAVTIGQALLFQVQFWRIGPDRGYAFDAAFPRRVRGGSVDGCVADLPARPGDLPGYIEAYWYGTLRGMDRTVRRARSDEVPPPARSCWGPKDLRVVRVIAEDGDYIAYRAGASSAAGLVPNGDFEETGTTTLGVYGAPIFGWASSPDAALFPGGARSETAHLVLGQITDTISTKQATSTLVAVIDETSLGATALIRAGAGSASTVRATIALVELDAQRRSSPGIRRRSELPAGGEWQQILIEPVELDPDTAYFNVTCYLEPGGTLGDTVEIDDIVVDAG
jgi:hypothetical protein